MRKEASSQNRLLKTGTIWFVLVALAIAPLFPLSNFVGHPHWIHVRWIPFQDFGFSRNMLKDVIGNTIWFMPFGYLLYCQLERDSGSHWTIVTIVAIAGCISLSIELFQVFCHSRFPSMTDVACNILGAGLGGYVAKKHPTTTPIALYLARQLEPTLDPKSFHNTSSVYRQDRLE